MYGPGYAIKKADHGKTRAATGALASAAGPVVGGLLAQVSWHWVFLINVPIGVGILVAALCFVPDIRGASAPAAPDLVGAFLLVMTIGALALALVKAPDWGWGSRQTTAVAGLAVVGLVLLWWRTIRHDSPVIEPDLLRVRTFAWANVTAILFSAAFAIGLLALGLWLQQVWHYSVLQSGLAISPGPLMVPVFAALSQRWAHRISAGVITATGCAVLAVGTIVLLTSVGEQPSYVREILPGWLLAGIGVGLALPTILSSAAADLPPNRSATGSAVVNMSRQVGAVLGVSLLVALLGSPVGFDSALAAFRTCWWVLVALTLLAIPPALGMTPRRPRPLLPETHPEGTDRVHSDLNHHAYDPSQGVTP